MENFILPIPVFGIYMGVPYVNNPEIHGRFCGLNYIYIKKVVMKNSLRHAR